MRVEEKQGYAIWKNVICTELGGSIPNMMKGKIATRQAKQSFNVLNFMLTGEKLPE